MKRVLDNVFETGGVLDEPLRRILGMLHARNLSHIVLAVADDVVVRQEAMAELGERLSGLYRLDDFDYADAPMPSLLRFYRQLSGNDDGPVCLFAHGLDVLKAHDTEAYEEALGFLNMHREDLTLAHGAVVLWLTTDTWEDVLEQAPDFADWESVGVTFALPEGHRIERTALGRLSIRDAEDLRRQVKRFREMLARPNLGAALEAEFTEQLDVAERRLGRVADVRRDYRLHLVDELREHMLGGFAPQVGGRVLSLPLSKVFLPLRAVEGRPALAEYAEEDLRWQQQTGDDLKRVRAAACASLGRQRVTHTAALLALLNDSDNLVRATAAAVLGRRPRSAAFRSLRDRPPGPEVRPPLASFSARNGRGARPLRRT